MLSLIHIYRAAEQTATVPEYPRNIRERLQGKKAVQTTPEKDGIQRMVDRAAKRAEGKGAGYDLSLIHIWRSVFVAFLTFLLVYSVKAAVRASASRPLKKIRYFGGELLRSFFTA